MTKRIIIGAILILLTVLTVYYFYPETKLPDGVVIDKISVLKSERKMLVYSKGQLAKTYKISLGKQPVGAKRIEGDKKTPEGSYVISEKREKSAYYKGLLISYPNNDDIENAEELGKSAGGAILIHGIRNELFFVGKFHRRFDWTLGCIAVTNAEMDELFKAVPVGTIIDIQP